MSTFIGSISGFYFELDTLY